MFNVLQFTDRHGRVFFMRMNIWALIVGDVFFILVYFFPTSMPGGYWALLFPAVLDGIFGGKRASIQ
jgi:hypothetical protein